MRWREIQHVHKAACDTGIRAGRPPTLQAGATVPPAGLQGPLLLAPCSPFSSTEQSRRDASPAMKNRVSTFLPPVTKESQSAGSWGGGINYRARVQLHRDVIKCVAKIQVPKKFIKGHFKPSCQTLLPLKPAYLVPSLVFIIRSITQFENGRARI